jgi:phosphate uptake regulator
MHMVVVASRKIQRVGRSTLSVSIPSAWAKERGIRQGDDVLLVSEADGSLRLVSSRSYMSRERLEECICNSDLCDEPKLLERIIVGNYILGREIISVISSERVSSEHIEEIRGIVSKLIGLAIVEETPDLVTLQCSVDPRKYSLEMLLRRLSTISLTMVKESGQALVRFDTSLAKDAMKREDEADAMYQLALRLLISAQRRREVAEEIGLSSPLHILFFGLMLRYLKLAADYAEENARRAFVLEKYKDRFPERIVQRMGDLNDLAYDLLVKSVDCFFIGDVKTASSTMEIQESIESERDKLMRELPEIPNLRLMLWNITRIADCGKDIALIGLNNSLDRKSNICTVKPIAR